MSAATGTRESEALLWARHNAREPWEGICDAADRISLGLPPRRARVRIPLIPFTIDYDAAYPFVGDLLGTLLFQPARLATVIWDPRERAVVRAYVEEVRDRHFVALAPFEPREEILDALERRDHAEVLEIINDQLDKPVDWVKIADMRFFETFAAAPVTEILRSVQRVVTEGWIAFHPTPVLFRWLEAWLGRVNGALPELPEVAGLPFVLAIRGDGYTVLMRANGTHLTLPLETGEKYDPVPFHRLAKAIVRDGLASLVIAVRAEPLLNILSRFLNASVDGDINALPRAIRRIGRFAARCGKWWSVHPSPLWMRRPAVWMLRAAVAPLRLERALPRLLAECGVGSPGSLLTIDGLATIRIAAENGRVRELELLAPEDDSGYKTASLPRIRLHTDAIRRMIALGRRKGWRARWELAGHLFRGEFWTITPNPIRERGAAGILRIVMSR